ncbi:MAG: hypothetical protein ACFE0Q_21500 [Anaerolineae bacterium]
MRFWIMILIVWAGLGNSNAQESSAITADNYQQLQSTQRLDFDVLEPAINSGWFTYDAQDNRFLLLGTNQDVYAVSAEDAEITATVPDLEVIDAVTFSNGFYGILALTERGFSVWYDNLSSDAPRALRVTVRSQAMPSALWVSCDEHTESQMCHAYVEATDGAETVIFTLPAFDPTQADVQVEMLNDADLPRQPYAPANDEQAVVRIGRIPLPYVITSSLDGMVTLWHLETGEALYQVDNGTGEPSVFGNINANATHLVWRDNANQTLYLLDFITGENRIIAPLDGDYAQWYFLTNDASTIIAVNLGSAPEVFMWDTVTGERTNLGAYRACERPQPDMTRMLPDDSALIIGCDTGLDIWRINEEAE